MVRLRICKDFIEAGGELEPLLDDSDQHVDRDCDPYLRLDSILGGAEKRLDPQMLLDPFEEQLDLPAQTVELGDGKGGQREVVGEKDQSLAGLGILEPDTSQRRGEALVRVEAGERDGLVAAETGASVDRMRVSALGLEVSLSPDDEEAAGLMKATEPIEVDVSAIHDVDGTGLGHQLIEDIDVVQLAGADEDEGWDIAPQIQERVQLDRRFGRAERRPGKDRETQIDRGGIERVDGVLEIEPERLVGVKSPGGADQALREIAVDAPIPRRVGIGQRVARNGAAKSQVIELGALHTQTRFDVAQALAIGQLCEG